MKPLFWMGSSRRDVLLFPKEARSEVGFALYAAQLGQTLINPVPLVGFGGAKVLEVISNHDGETYRAIYTVKFNSAVYVLHAFQKKSKSGIKTPQRDMDLIRSRLKSAEAHYLSRTKRVGKTGTGK